MEEAGRGSGGNSRPTGPGLVETQPEIQKEPGILDEEAAEPKGDASVRHLAGGFGEFLRLQQ